MTTPQMTLQNINYNLKCLVSAFHRNCEDEDGNEKNYDLFDDIIDIKKDQEKIIQEMKKLNDTMALILKVLNK